jgi:hypothetical protein
VYPTGWGWITIAFSVAISGLFVWRFQGEKRLSRGMTAAMFVSLILLFLFSFMQWATWYK